MIDKKKYRELFTSELSAIRDNTVWQDDSGEYYLFGVYKIVTKSKDAFEVFKHNTRLMTLSRLVSCVSWCVADKNNRHDITTDICSLDRQLTRVMDDVNAGRHQIQRCKESDARYILEVKIDNKIQHMLELERRLKQCFKITKQWQQRGFTNETKRSSDGITR